MNMGDHLAAVYFTRVVVTNNHLNQLQSELIKDENICMARNVTLEVAAGKSVTFYVLFGKMS